jgi:hypothetical protein
MTRTWWCLVLAGVTGCSGESGSGGGEVSLRWTGSASGSLSAPATARWCPADSLLEVIAVRGDTSVGLALLGRDSIRAEPYPVVETRDFTPGRPQARVALRLLKEFELEGYEGSGGAVTVTGNGATVSGTVDVRLRPVVGADTLRITGSFDGVTVTTAVGVCGRAGKPLAR